MTDIMTDLKRKKTLIRKTNWPGIYMPKKYFTESYKHYRENNVKQRPEEK